MLNPTATDRWRRPVQPHALPRKRLMERLDSGLGHSLWLITGQAAQGKTTLVSSWVGASGLATAWLSLEPGDSAADRLVYSLAVALAGFSGEDPQQLLAALGVGQQPALGEAGLARTARLVFSAMPAGSQLVLDGLDQLAEDAPGPALVQALCEAAPDDRRLILLSRQRPPAFNRAAAIRPPLTMDNSELACTPDEVAELLGRQGGEEPDPETVEAVHQITEGWIGGVVLFCELLASLGKSRALAMTRLKGELFQYIARNIFEQQEPAMQDFLLACSSFGLLDPRVMARLTGLEEAGQILEELWRRNLFLSVERSQDGRRLYRLHQLFRLFLSRRYEERYDQAQRVWHQARAGRILAEEGRWEEATRFLLKAGQHQEAARAILRAAPQMLDTGRLSDLEQWLSALPAEMVEKNPWLLYFLCQARRWRSLEDILAALPRLREGFARAGDQRGLLLAQALCLDTVMAGQPWPQLESHLREAESLLERAAPEEFLAERAALLTNYGFIQALRGSPLKGSWALEQAFILANQLRDPFLAVRVLVFQTDAYNFSGELELAAAAARRLERLLSGLGLAEAPVETFIPRCYLHLLRGELDRSRRILDQAQERITRDGLLFLLPVRLIYEIIWAAQAGRMRLGRECEAQLRALPSWLTAPFVLGGGKVLLAIGEVRHGDASTALSLAEAAWEELATDLGWAPSHTAACAMVQVMASWALGIRLEGIEEKLDHAWRIARDMGSRQVQTECEVLRALAEAGQGREEEAARWLEQAVARSRDKGYVYFIILGVREVARAMALAVRLDRPGEAEHLAEVLLTRQEPGYPHEAARMARHPDPEIRRLVGRVRSRLVRDQAPRLSISTLGGFRAELEGEPLEERRWGRKQARHLLMAIIALGPGKVPRDRLMEALWPQADPASAARSFRVTLHRLRKALEQDLDQGAGSSYIVKDGDAVGLNPRLCHLDLAEFRRLGEEARRQGEDGQAMETARLLERAAELYQGDFLADEPYLAWAEEPRRLVRQEYVELMGRLAGLQTELGMPSRAVETLERIIAADPVNEPAYQSLMRLQARAGLVAEALRTYHKCAENLSESLDAQPGWVTRSLHEEIQELDG